MSGFEILRMKDVSLFVTFLYLEGDRKPLSPQSAKHMDIDSTESQQQIVKVQACLGRCL
jgi:hypothetical protein